MEATDDATSSSLLEGLVKNPKIENVLTTVALHALQAATKAARPSIISLLTSLTSYQNYMEETYQKVSTFKAFVDPSQKIPLIDHFVTSNCKDRDGNEFDTVDLLERLKKPANFVISATAGYGKSVLMKYLALMHYENPQGKIPIFVELRDVNRLTSPNLKTYINASYRQKTKTSDDIFTEGLKRGLFILILDGFDEVNYDIREDIESQILTMANEFRQCTIIVSGRPDEKFYSWARFEVIKVCPMSDSAVIELISKLRFDEDTKLRFIDKIKSGKLKKHDSFLNTPLLATLMLLIFKEDPSIPDKMHIFYQRAFETLYYKHDSYKEQYERKRRSNLRVDQFVKVFSAFCLNSYILEKLEFSNTDLIEAVEDAVRYAGFETQTDDIIFDITESICLIQREGFLFYFVHRSFQEYFTAYFLSQCEDDIRDDFLDNIPLKHWDNVLEMLYEMSTDRLESSWIRLKLDQYLDDTNARKSVFTSALEARWKSVCFVRTKKGLRFDHMIPGKHWRLLMVLDKFYQDRVSSRNYLSTSDIDAIANIACKAVGENYLPLRGLAFENEMRPIVRIDFSQLDRVALRETEVWNRAVTERRQLSSIRSGLSESAALKQTFLKKALRRPA